MINRLGSSNAEKIGINRFVNNGRVEPDSVLEAMQAHTKGVLLPRHYLCIQDTSEANYARNNGRRDPDELGLVGNDVDHGFFAHVCLMVDTVELCPVGIGDVELWGRDNDSGKAEGSKVPAKREKESKRWHEGPDKCKGLLPDGATMTVVGDREMDKYEVMAKVPDGRTHILFRCDHNRVLASGEKLYSLFDRQPVQGEFWVWLQARKGRPAREALLEVKFGKVVIPRTEGVDRELSPEVAMHWVEVREKDSTLPAGGKRVHWRLLTTHAVETLADALQIVKWYQARWEIEQFFRTLKSKGLNVEESQLETQHALRNMLLMAMQAAIQIMQLTYSRSGDSVYSAAIIFDSKTLVYLELIVRKYEGKTQKQRNPYRLHSIPWARWGVARMGGWDGYASQSKAGPITMKRGLQKLYTMIEGIEIMASEDVYRD